MSKRTPGQPDDTGLPDIADLGTASLAEHQTLAEQRRRQIAEHEYERKRLHTLALAAWRAVRSIDERLREATDRRLRAVLEHNRSEMEAWHDELDAKMLEHERAIEQLERQR